MKNLLIDSAIFGLCFAAQTTLGANPKFPIVKTTSGILQGSEQHGVLSFKGIPYGHAPIETLRWEPPKPFISTAIRNTTVLGPSCIQQFTSLTQNLTDIFNPSPPPESEDCLYLNVWAPSRSDSKKPVAFWIHGGGYAFGTASFPGYDGTSFVLNQDIVIVTINYRTNVYGFPGAEELFPTKENLGLMDQDLALQWVQHNVAAFGGDPNKVTIMGQSAGSMSVAHALQRHASNPPFRAAIMESGAATSMSPVPNFASFDALSKAVNCTQPPGADRLACMKTIPVDVIRTWADGPQGLNFLPVVDNTTVFPNPIQRIAQKKTARVPIISGANQDEGSLFSIGATSLPDFLIFLNTSLSVSVTPDDVRAAYPGLTDIQIIPNVIREFLFVCPTEVTTGAFVGSGMKDVFRYMYGAVFEDLQLFPNAGAWHSSEVGEIFGTYNISTATPSEVTLSNTMQTIWANFMKNPTTPPAINWPRYVLGNDTQNLAKLAYDGNVELPNVVQPASSGTHDSPCDTLWNQFITF